MGRRRLVVVTMSAVSKSLEPALLGRGCDRGRDVCRLAVLSEGMLARAFGSWGRKVIEEVDLVRASRWRALTAHSSAGPPRRTVQEPHARRMPTEMSHAATGKPRNRPTCGS
jgi:hypothetical protein